jgi:hypothetical protein
VRRLYRFGLILTVVAVYTGWWAAANHMRASDHLLGGPPRDLFDVVFNIEWPLIAALPMTGLTFIVPLAAIMALRWAWRGA